MYPKNLFFFSLLIIILYLPVSAQEHPHILVNKDDKLIVLKKIEQQSWASTIYKEIANNVTPYVEKHKTDPEWILSRYLMNRIPGKRYTQAFSDNGGMKLSPKNLLQHWLSRAFGTITGMPLKAQPWSLLL